MHLIKSTLAISAAIALIGCAGLPAGGPQKDKTYQLTILHTNDHHGRFWQNSDGEYGMAARKTLIDQYGQPTAMIQMAVGQQHAIDGRRQNGQRLPIEFPQGFDALKLSAIDQNPEAVAFDQGFGPRYRSGSANKFNLHDFTILNIFTQLG